MLHVRHALFAGALSLLAPVSAAQDGAVPLAGDTTSTLAIDDQSHVQIAPGGTGYLMVWEEERTVIGPYIDAGGENLLGNQRDIYGARLDAAGNLLDPSPIVICNLGRNQRRPRAAWDGGKWLVVFVTERPDWYFFNDIVGVRVAADGTVLDATPLPIRMQPNTPSNYAGDFPSVLGRNGDWVVVWEDFNPVNLRPSIKGTRVSDAGVVLDPSWPTLHEHNNVAFGPRTPEIVPLGGELLLTWLELNSGPRYRRLSSTLAPIGSPIQITGGSSQVPHAASDGSTAMILSGLKAWRVGMGGALLDPSGITVSTADFDGQNPPAIAWNGTSFSTTFSASDTLFTPGEVYVVRVSAAGQVLDPTPINATSNPSDEWFPAVAGAGGATQLAFQRRSNGFHEDSMAVQVDAAGTPGAIEAVGLGWGRQERVQTVTTPAAHYLVYVRRDAFDSRVLLQRVGEHGDALDAEPVIVTSGPGTWSYLPVVAFDGSRLLVAWNDPSNHLAARRFGADLTPLDPQPIALFPSSGAVAAAGHDGVFLVAGPVLFSGDLNQLHARRIDSNGTVLDATSLVLGNNWVETPVLTRFGAGWLATWTRRPTHDSPSSAIRARFVRPDGTLPAADFQVSAGRGFAHHVAAAGDVALIAWVDDSDINDERVEGRLLEANASMPTPEFVICDQPNHQSFPAVTDDGSQFLVLWVDYRLNGIVDQHRGDVYGGRVSYSGATLDPAGIQITSGSLPEELPRVSTLHNVSRAFWLDLRPAPTPYVQRVVHRAINDLLPGAWANLGLAEPGVAGDPALYGHGAPIAGNTISIRLEHAAANAPALIVLGFSRVDLPFLGGTLVPSPDVVVAVSTSAAGTSTLPPTWPAGIPSGTSFFFQVLVSDPAAALGVAASNGLSVTQP